MNQKSPITDVFDLKQQIAAMTGSMPKDEEHGIELINGLLNEIQDHLDEFERQSSQVDCLDVGGDTVVINGRFRDFRFEHLDDGSLQVCGFGKAETIRNASRIDFLDATLKFNHQSTEKSHDSAASQIRWGSNRAPIARLEDGILYLNGRRSEFKFSKDDFGNDPRRVSRWSILR